MAFVLNRHAESLARAASVRIRDYFNLSRGDVPARIGVLFISGLDQYVEWDCAELGCLPFKDIDDFAHLKELGEVKDHKRELFRRRMGGQEIWGLKGRIHLNEDPRNPGKVNEMVRLQFDMLFHLGIDVLILTSAVGSVTQSVMVGQTGVVTNLLVDASTVLTGFSGEFVGLDDALCPELQKLMLGAAPMFHAIPAVHHYERGPFIENESMKRNMARLGAVVVGQSGTPGIEAAARHGVKVLFNAYVTNGFVHDENVVGNAIKEYGHGWMEDLTQVVREIPETLSWK